MPSVGGSVSRSSFRSFVQRYLRLVGPAILAALAAGNTAFAEDAEGHNAFHLGIEWIAVTLGVVLIAWRGSVFVGILAAVVLVALSRTVMGA
jgi:branched-subunit amino acid transport protein